MLHNFLLSQDYKSIDYNWMSTFISKLFFLNIFGNGRGIYKTYRAREVFDFMARKQPKHESVFKEASMKFRNL